MASHVSRRGGLLPLLLLGAALASPPALRGGAAAAAASTAASTAASGALTWLAASDTHLGHDVGPKNGSIVTSVTKNEWAIDLMNNVTLYSWPASLGGDAIAPPALLTVSGDLIDNGSGDGAEVNGCHQWANFSNLYGFDGTDGRVHLPVYEGRGNHDGQNSTNALPTGCASVPAREVAARNALRRADARFGIDNVSLPTGLHYSWTTPVSATCRLHFVHLNLFPGHGCGSPANPGREGPSSGGGFPCTDGWTWPEDSLGFLESDLAAYAVAPGTMVVTIFHYGLDGWSNTWYNSDQREELIATLLKYKTLAVFVGHTHAADLYSFNGTDQGAFDDARPGFVPVVNAPATQKEDGDHNALPSEFMVADVTVDAATGAGRFRVGQRVGTSWGEVLGERAFTCA